MKIKTIFGDELDEEVLRYASEEDLKIDLKHFFTYDVYVYIAHVLMLFKEGYLKENETIEALKGLSEILKEREKISIEDLLKEGIEDIHSLIEFLLTKKSGEVGMKCRFNLSRNDESSALQQMKLRDECIEIVSKLLNLCEALMKIAYEYRETVIPSFTHSQVAQPITMGYYWLCFIEEILRDVEELRNLEKFILNSSPLGACSIAGAPEIEGIGVDRKLVAHLLGFEEIFENTIDATIVRGEVALRFLSSLGLIAFHISRVCEDLIDWMSLGMVEIGESFTSGSSVMPQKKNPDIAELIRARCSRVLGKIAETMFILKGLPKGYNRDFQELKQPIIESINLLKSSIDVFTEMLMTVRPNEEIAKKLLTEGWSTSSDLASAISVKLNVPYREAYLIVKKYVSGMDLVEAFKEVTGKPMSISEEFVSSWLDLKESIKRRSYYGGMNPSIVERSIEERKEKVKVVREWITKEGRRIKSVYSKLEEFCENPTKAISYIRGQ